MIARVPEQYKVAAICDPLADRQSDARWPEAQPCETIEELLALPGIELVVVASPNKLHAQHALAALRAGKHVLCEKPFGFTTTDVDAMIVEARKAGVVLQPFQQRRYEADFQKVREVCQSGLLGSITFVRISWVAFTRRWDWQTAREFGGGQLYNNGPHPLDHALELFGDHEPEVWCDLRRSLASGDAEDEVQILLKAPGAPAIQIDLLATAAYPQDRWYICGTLGGLRGNTDRLEWKWVDWNTMPERPLDTRPTENRSYNSEKLTWQEDSWTAQAAADAGAGAAPANQPTADLYEALWQSIREGAPQTILPSAVRRRVAILQRCYQLLNIPFPKGALLSQP
ncbi:hypothetical protein BH09VER1_BH09VER1_45040 [soil metagenome]